MAQKRFQIDTDATDEEWDDLLAEVVKDIEEGPKKPEPLPQPPVGHIPWFGHFPWPMPGEDD